MKPHWTDAQLAMWKYRCEMNQRHGIQNDFLRNEDLGHLVVDLIAAREALADQADFERLRGSMKEYPFPATTIPWDAETPDGN